LHQYNVGTLFNRAAINIARLFPGRRGSQHLFIAMDYFTKCPEVYAIPNYETSTVADSLVNFFCCFGVPREQHSNQSQNFESQLLQEVLWCLGICKMRTTSLHPQSDGMLE
jgi:hypothetical protein